MEPVSLIDVASYLPENRVGSDYFVKYAGNDRLAHSVMFRAPAYRHHVAEDETAADMVERAVAPLIDRHGADTISNVDVLITHTQLPDLPVIGCGQEVAHRLGARPEWVIDLHNGGCASFVYMLKLARQILQTSSAKTALIAATQNSAGQFFTQTEVRKLVQAAIPGDGCGVGLVTKTSDSPILDIECRTYGEYCLDMTGEVDPPRKYWEPGTGQYQIGFNEERIAKIFARGSRLVPEVALALCDRLGIKSTDVDIFITNQPNRVFLRNWREAMQLPPERHRDSYNECGNLFGAGIPVTLDREVQAGRVPKDSLVLMAAFAHAGDFAGAAAVRWGGSE